MRFALDHPHPLWQIFLAIFVLTLIAFAMEGCPSLAIDKYHQNQNAVIELHSSEVLRNL